MFVGRAKMEIFEGLEDFLFLTWQVLSLMIYNKKFCSVLFFGCGSQDEAIGRNVNVSVVEA